MRRWGGETGGESRLVIECDGAYHTEEGQAESDRIRDRLMQENSLTVLRFTNGDVFERTQFVLDTIAAHLAE